MPHLHSPEASPGPARAPDQTPGNSQAERIRAQYEHVTDWLLETDWLTTNYLPVCDHWHDFAMDCLGRSRVCYSSSLPVTANIFLLIPGPSGPFFDEFENFYFFGWMDGWMDLQYTFRKKSRKAELRIGLNALIRS